MQPIPTVKIDISKQTGKIFAGREPSWSDLWFPPDSKVHGASMGWIWGWQHLGGPHVGPMNFAIWAPFKFLWPPEGHQKLSICDENQQGSRELLYMCMYQISLFYLNLSGHEYIKNNLTYF